MADAAAPDPLVPYPPMEAEHVASLPLGPDWQYEPKWDGFRGVLENVSGELRLWSRNGRPLLRYFPELLPLADALPPRSALDGEIVVVRDGALDFDAMQMRLHPAESRIRRLSAEIPSLYVAFDVLVWDGEPWHERPLRERRAFLEASAGAVPLSGCTADAAVAEGWLDTLEAAGLDGVIGKRLDLPYAAGRRDRVVKVKRRRTADCVVVGVRWKTGGTRVATLSLGLHDESGALRHVGSAAAPARAGVEELVAPLLDGEPRMPPPGEGSRWTRGKEELAWSTLRPELVVEVEFDKLQGDRIRHGAKLIRFRSDKDASACTLAELRPPRRPGDPTAESLLLRR